MRAIRYDAAGGVVVDADKVRPLNADKVRPSGRVGDGGRTCSFRVLVLRRPNRDEVRLPKGHLDKGESPPEAALREVTEESGYADIEITADLGHQIVEFNYKNAHVIRDERYFLMRLCTLRQIEREATERQFIPDWLSWEEALSELTFEAVLEWVRRARKHT